MKFDAKILQLALTHGARRIPPRRLTPRRKPTGSGKISVKNSRIGIVLQMSTGIEWFVTNETFHLSKKSEKFVDNFSI